MRAVPSRPGSARDSDGSLSSPASSSQSFFCKDGRKIRVGDCALIKSTQDSLPSIGLIFRITATKDNNLKLGVNWLLRPTEVKLGKGILLEAAPNEIFYSFKKDEIPAATLLHICKVAFLPKGVELPLEISSFVCRRVYDIANRRLLWLTDKDHFHEEIDQLLYKTQMELHASAPLNGRSPKQTSGSMSTSQLKPGKDSLQTTVSLPAQSKGKKRDCSDQSTDPVRHGRSLKLGDGDSGCCSLESQLKSEIAKIAEKGQLVDTEGVDKLVQVMYFELNEKKVDLSIRMMLMSIIIATEKSDCLSRFVQIKGLSVLDDWLHDVHKGKTGDDNNHPKDNDKLAGEFLLILLRALDKLPVNLPALQMCNIGKSVNQLRTHKNLEIQKKARSLVDKWKKHVEAEMNIYDARTGSNQAVSGSARTRSQLSEVSHVNRNIGGSFEASLKNSSNQLSTSKTAPAKLLQGETASKSTSQFEGSIRLASPQASVGVNLKDGLSHFGSNSSEVPLATSRDEKSSSSSQSNNSSLSSSGDHVKNGGSALKEDARNSCAALNKMPSLASHHRKSVNGFPMPAASAREAAPSRNASSHKNVAPDKASHSGLTSEKTADVASEVNSHKFMVKIPSGSRSPAQKAAGGSLDDSSAMADRPSSPVLLDRHDKPDAVVEERTDASQANTSLDANTETWQGNDFRDTVVACDEGDTAVDPGPNEENLNNENVNTPVVSKSSTSSPRDVMEEGKVPGASINPMNALIESCIKYAEADVQVPCEDDVGMHLLASVAEEEILQSELASPAGSTHGNPSPVEPSCNVGDPEMKPLPLGSHSQDGDPSKDAANDNTQDHLEGCAHISSKGGGKTYCLCPSEQPVAEEDRNLNSSCVNAVQLAVQSPGSDKVTHEVAVDASYAGNSEQGRQGSDVIQDTEVNVNSPVSPVNRVKAEITKSEVETEMGSISGRDGRKLDRDSDYCGQLEVKTNGNFLLVETNLKELKIVDELGAVEVSEMDAVNKNKQNKKPDALMILEVQTVGGPVSGIEEPVESEAVSEEKFVAPASRPQLELPLQGVRDKSREYKGLNSKEADETEECNSSGANTSVAQMLGGGIKLEFDLNESLDTDDCKFGESMNFSTTASSAVTVPSISQLPVGNSSLTASLSAPIAVTAATAKGTFIPPDDLLREKVEIRLKGSAAMSAFYSAEPRRVLEMPAYTTSSVDMSLGKQSHPVLDFDLNLVDERTIEDTAPQSPPLGIDSLYNFGSNVEKVHHEMTDPGPTRGSGGLDLDLNCADETSTDGANYSGQNEDVGAFRKFDLNDEPVADASEFSTSGQLQLRSSKLGHQPPLSGPWVDGADVRNISALFHAGNGYPAASVPAILSNRDEQSLPIVAPGGLPRILEPSAGGIQFHPEMYRGPVLSSSPGLSFPSAPFQYSMLPYGTSFPLPSATLSGSSTTYIDPSSGGRLPVHPQLLGPAGAVTSHFSRPYMFSLSDGSRNGNIEGSKTWSRQWLDLNTGPGGPELECRDEKLPLGPRQLSIGAPQSLAVEQAKMYQVSAGLLKRKEPDSGWDGYKQLSWQQ